MSTTTTLPELLAPPRATEPTEARLTACLREWPAIVVQMFAQAEAYRVFVPGDVPAALVPHWLAIIRRTLEDGGYDIAHRVNDAGRPCVAVYAPGAP